jgi:hypothetical protein
VKSQPPMLSTFKSRNKFMTTGSARNQWGMLALLET